MAWDPSQPSDTSVHQLLSMVHTRLLEEAEAAFTNASYPQHTQHINLRHVVDTPWLASVTSHSAGRTLQRVAWSALLHVLQGRYQSFLCTDLYGTSAQAH